MPAEHTTAAGRLGSWRTGRFCGYDLDEVLAYQTPRVAKIADYNLGLLHLLLMIAIVIYIFVIQIAYHGEQFQVAGVRGSYRLQLQQPTVNHCNPMVIGCEANYAPLSKLPYCKEVAGSNTNSTALIQKNCQFLNAEEVWRSEGTGKLLLTSIQTYNELPACQPSAENGFSCSRKYKFAGGGAVQPGKGEKAVPDEDIFPADIEHFTLLVDHAYSRKGGGMANDDFQMQGYWNDCEGKDPKSRKCEKKPIPCAHDKCPDHHAKAETELLVTPALGFLRHSTETRAVQSRLNAEVAKEGRSELLEEAALGTGFGDDQPIVAITQGDVMSIKALLHMAGIKSLDEEVKKTGKTYRSMGVNLVMHIDYTNKQPWHIFSQPSVPEYLVEVYLRPTYEYQVKFMNQNAPLIGGRSSRVLYKCNGIKIDLEQSGALAMFDLTRLLIVLTTSLGLLAVSATLTDFIAFNVMKKKEKYKACKYVSSGDMHPDIIEKPDAD